MAEAENKGLMALAGAALLGVGAYLWLKGAPPKPLGESEFGPIKFSASVGALPKVKNVGDTWSGTIVFPHRGRGTSVAAILNVTPPDLFTLWGEQNLGGGVPDVDWLRRYALGDPMPGTAKIPDEVNWTTRTMTIGPFAGLLIPATSETYLGVLVVLTDAVSGKVVQYAWFNNIYQVLQAPEFGDVTATWA